MFALGIVARAFHFMSAALFAQFGRVSGARCAARRPPPRCASWPAFHSCSISPFRASRRWRSARSDSTCCCCSSFWRRSSCCSVADGGLLVGKRSRRAPSSSRRSSSRRAAIAAALASRSSSAAFSARWAASSSCCTCASLSHLRDARQWSRRVRCSAVSRARAASSRSSSALARRAAAPTAIPGGAARSPSGRWPAPCPGRASSARDDRARVSPPTTAFPTSTCCAVVCFRVSLGLLPRRLRCVSSAACASAISRSRRSASASSARNSRFMTSGPASAGRPPVTARPW